jgi:hypothetical protein
MLVREKHSSLFHRGVTHKEKIVIAKKLFFLAIDAQLKYINVFVSVLFPGKCF